MRVPLADALGRARSPQAVEAFTAAMPAAATELRIRIVRALARIGSPGAVEAVRGAMSDRNWRVRAQAAWSLARMGDPTATALLEQGLADGSPWVRANCTAALRRLAQAPVLARPQCLFGDRHVLDAVAAHVGLRLRERDDHVDRVRPEGLLGVGPRRVCR